MVDFDAGDVVDRHLFQLDGPAGAGRCRAGEIEPAHGHRHVVGGGTAHRNRARVAAAVVDADARDEFQKLTDVALGDVAEFVGRDHIHHVGGKPLFIDRDGSAVHFLRG